MNTRVNAYNPAVMCGQFLVIHKGYPTFPGQRDSVVAKDLSMFGRVSHWLLLLGICVCLLSVRAEDRVNVTGSTPTVTKPNPSKSPVSPKENSEAEATRSEPSNVSPRLTKETTSNPGKTELVKSVMSGRVVLLTKALASRDIQHYAEDLGKQVVLETAEGEWFPIVPDWRGRAFFQDERLRDRPVDLIVQRRGRSPFLQVLSIYTFDESGARQLTDYWCDICAIPMYEIKDCECCQGPIRLRYQRKELPKALTGESASDVQTGPSR